MPDRSPNTGSLTLVPTPIGNLGDITLRAIEVLKDADAIYSEDTRVTGKLLSALGIKRDKQALRRLDENLMSSHAKDVIAEVEAGKIVAYCTDAGMPGVSDPGLRLVDAARAEGLKVEVLPGASAAATAYVQSACSSQKYYFGGFFPRKDSERTTTLSELADLDAALIFYESPHRVVAALQAIANVLPHRKVSVCRELTKLHEEIVQGAPEELAKEFKAREEGDSIRGEIVIVIDAPSDEEHEVAHVSALEKAAEEACLLSKQGESQKSITKSLMEKFGISKNEAYRIALQAKDANGS